MITQGEIKDIINENLLHKKRHEHYEKAVLHDLHMRFHVDGYEKKEEKPENGYSWAKYSDYTDYWFNHLIGDRRPNENPEVLEYRKKIYKSKTKTPCFKVVNSVKKGLKAPDWKIDWNEVKEFPRIKEGETLKDYMMHNFPIYGSIENWLYTYALKRILSEPNGIFVIRANNTIDKSEYVKPYIEFASAENILYESDTAIMYRTKRKHEFVEKDIKYSDFIVSLIDDTYIYDIKKTSNKGDYEIVISYTHKLGYLPYIKSGGYIKEEYNGCMVYNSLISPMLPSLDEGVRIYSDKQAEYVQNIFSTMWAYEVQECNDCKGLGKVKKAGEQIVCPSCEGKGTMRSSPYGKMILKAPAVGEQGVPTPPAGYVEKSTEMARILDEAFKSEMYEALSAINMEFLAETPLNESGVAKEIDRDELNNFVYGVYSHIVNNVLYPVFKIIADYRYIVLIPSKEERKLMIPDINIPETFELLNEKYLLDHVGNAIQKQINPLIIKTAEMQLIRKKFANDKKTQAKLVAIMKLDPFSGRNKENIIEEVLAGYISEEDANISQYIQQYVQEAIEENDKFLELEYLQQLEVIRKKASDKIQSIKKSKINMTNGNGEETPPATE